jgi:hypothetical protein
MYFLNPVPTHFGFDSRNYFDRRELAFLDLLLAQSDRMLVG